MLVPHSLAAAAVHELSDDSMRRMKHGSRNWTAAGTVAHTGSAAAPTLGASLVVAFELADSAS